jgi:DNA-binding SARP family transcriptional activator
MDFRILGPLWVGHDDIDLTPTAPKVRQVLAFLLLRCGSLVQVAELIDELWRDEPPSSAITTLQTYIYKIRKDVLGGCSTARLHTQVSGYVLDVSAEGGDLLRFERLAHEGRALLESGDPRRAADVLREALSLWRGSPLADVATGEILSAYVTRLEEERLHTLELRITADLLLGRHQQLVSELKMLVSEQPLNERLHAHLMTVLHRSGRRHEALETYQGLRRMLIDELGVEPSASVQQLHLALLDSDAEVENVSSGAHDRFETVPTPAQLPPDISDFVGRADVLQRIHRHLVHSEGGASTMRAVSLSGMPGAGKTVLALRAAHTVRTEFPDGQFYADLRGTTDVPADPRDLLEGFARAIGVPAHAIPDSLPERSKLFRSWSMGKRVLVVLDDAHSVAQITPLLPASPGCAVIITSRCGLYTLPGALHLKLGLMSLDEAVQLIESASGCRYTGTQRGVVERAARLAGCLPIALRSFGSRLAAMQTWPIDKLVRQLEDTRRRLDVLAFADLDFRTRIETGYERLDSRDRDAFRAVSLLAPRFSAADVARMVGDDIDEVEAQLLRLVRHNLLSTTETSSGESRYWMHELVHIYARESAEREVLVTSPAGPRQLGEDGAARPLGDERRAAVSVSG